MAVGDTNLNACTVKLSLNSNLGYVWDFRTVADVISKTWEVKLADGTGAEKGNQVWADERTLAYGGSDSLDMYGVLTNTKGTTVNFTKIRVIILASIVGNLSTIEYGGAASDPWYPMFKDASDVGVILLPGTTYPAVAYMDAPDASGFAVGASSADIFKIAHGGENSADVTYDIVLIGEG